MSKCIDMTGQKFGKLTVLKRVENDKFGKAQWLCQCDCGNQKIINGSSIRKGLTVSCGCYAKEKLQEYNDSKVVDEIGKRYGRLVVISRDTSEEFKKDGRAMWLCQCDCGNQVVVSGKNLRNGHTKSCGCLMLETVAKIGEKTGPQNGGIMFIDLLGQKFGKLTVLERAENTPYGQAQWLCQCDCGSKIIVPGSALRSGNTCSCGCIKSKGEEKISNLLTINNISFSREYQVQLSSTKNCRFDFAIFENNKLQYLIEYDGSQHFFTTESGWNTKENLLQTKENDKLKNNWCFDNNIPLIRIPYTHFLEITINDLLLETSQFILKHEG